MLDGEQARFDPAEERPEIHARAIKVLFVLEGLVTPAEDGRTADDIDAHPGRRLPRRQRTIEAPEYAAGIARLPADPAGRSPIADRCFQIERRYRRQFALPRNETVLFGTRKPEFRLHIVVAPCGKDIEVRHQHIAVNPVVLLVGIENWRQRGISDDPETIVANIELRGAARQRPGRLARPALRLPPRRVQPIACRHFGRQDRIQPLANGFTAFPRRKAAQIILELRLGLQPVACSSDRQPPAAPMLEHCATSAASGRLCAGVRWLWHSRIS